MRKSVLFLTGILLLCSSLSFAQQDDKELIQDLAQTWVDVTINEDIDGLLKILTDDVIIFSPNAEPAKSKSTIKDIYSPYYQAYDLEITAKINEIQISENIAYNNLWVLKKNQSGWKLWRLMFNSPS